VVITCIVVAVTSRALEQKFEGFRQVGGVVGIAVSASVLILPGLGNSWILVKLIQRMRKILKEDDTVDLSETGNNVLVFDGGIMVMLFQKVF
jgi:high-affinity nickel-transport protein